MKLCPNCGHANDDECKFCLMCGSALADVTPEPQPQPIVAEPVPQPQPVQPAPQPQPVSQPVAQPAPVTAQPNTSYQASYAAKEQKANGLCVAGLVTSLVSILCCGATAIIGLILSICGLVSANKKGQKGKGMAIAGIIISVVLTISGVLAFIFWGAAFTEAINEMGGYTPSTYPTSDDKDYDDDDIEDSIVDESWVETHGSSYLVFGSGKTFKYYKDYGELNNNYYEGKYELYVGEDAFEYITDDLEEYGVTEEELNRTIKNNKQYDEDNLVCLVLNNNTCMIDGENTLDDTVVSPYFGFYLVDDDGVVLDLASMNAAEYFTFIPEDQYTGGSTVPTSDHTEPSLDTVETSDPSSAPTDPTSTFGLTVLGNDTVGTIQLTQGSWQPWVEANGGWPEMVVSAEAAMNVSTGSIIHVQALDTDSTAEDLAQAALYKMDQVDHATDVTGAHVTIGGYEALQAYGLYSDGTYLVCWYFEGDDGYIHYISVEFDQDDYASFEMVENNYKLNR